MEALTPEQLCEICLEYLKSPKSVVEADDDVISAVTAFKDQKINGKRALKLSTSDLFHLGVAYGTAMDVKSLIDAVKEYVESGKVLPGCKTPLDSQKAQSSEPLQKAQSIEPVQKAQSIEPVQKAQSIEPVQKAQSIEPLRKAKTIDIYNEIRQYFTPAEFNQLSDYDKDVHLNLKRNYDEICANGPEGMIVPVPQFMQLKRLKTSPLKPKLKLKETSALKPKLKLKEEDFVAKLPLYDVDEILSKAKGQKVKELRKALNSGNILTSAHSKLLIRTLILQVFCESDGTYKSSVTSDQKDGLAASIVKRYPAFQDATDRGKWSWTLPTFLSKIKMFETLPSLTDDDSVTNDDIQGCLWIANKMPWQNLRRFGRVKTEELLIENLVKIIPAGTDVRTIIDERRLSAKGPVQPYLISLIPRDTITKMFAVADNKTVKIESSSFIKGLDVLFKMFHAFDVKYPQGWTRFFEFLEWGFFKLNPNKLTNGMKDLITKVESHGA